MPSPRTASWIGGRCGCGGTVGKQRQRREWEAGTATDQELERFIIDSLRDKYRSGAPPTFRAQQVVQIVAIACEEPTASGYPISHWTPQDIAVEAIKRGIVESISVRPGQVEKRELEYKRHGTQTLIANIEVAPGAVIAPTIGPRRPELDFAQHIAPDPHARWVFGLDQLNIHLSATLVRVVAAECDLDDDLGVKGKTGILKSMATRMAFLQDPAPHLHLVYVPKHRSWLNQIEIWFSSLVRRLLKRASFTATHDLKQRLLDFIDSFNRVLAKPFQWTYAGRPLQA